MEGSELTEWEMVVVGHNNSTNNPDHHVQDLSVFPPKNHEGLQILSPPQDDTDHQPIVSDVESNAEDGEREEGNEIRKQLTVRLEMLRSGVFWVASRVHGCYVNICRDRFLSYASVSTLAVVAALVLMSCNLQRWRQRVWEEREKRLTLLIKQKDQKINQLLLQIAHLKEMLLARRRVPVVRVVAEKYLT